MPDLVCFVTHLIAYMDFYVYFHESFETQFFVSCSTLISNLSALDSDSLNFGKRVVFPALMFPLNITTGTLMMVNKVLEILMV